MIINVILLVAIVVLTTLCLIFGWMNQNLRNQIEILQKRS